jgi:proteasome accessory factor C
MTDLRNQLIRLLKAISLLSNEGGRNIKQLATALGVTDRTAYRYKEVLEEVGFKLDQDATDFRYHVARAPRNLRPNLSFTAEEVDLVMQLLRDHAQSSTIKAISDKLYVHSDLLTVPNRLLEAQFGANVATVQQALLARRQIWLRGYRSVNSSEITDRLVEPVDLQDHYRRLFAYDPEKKDLRQFRLERVGKVELGEQPCRYTHPTAKVETDVFWYMGAQKIRVALQLEQGAYDMMREEFPRVEECVQPSGLGTYRFETDLYGLPAIGSWILRLPDKIQIISPVELKEHVRERIGRLNL